MKNSNRCTILPTLKDGGVGVELGVAKGIFSRSICDLSPLSKVYGIDRYKDHHDHREMRDMLILMKDEIDSGRYEFLRGTFASLCGHFEDSTFDFIYIDGYAHTGQEAGGTLEDWWPKLSPGGIFSGHDYDKRYQPTIDAVDAFVQRHNLELTIVEEQEGYASWLVEK